MLCLWAVLLSGYAYAQSPVSVSVTKKNMAVNENIALEITANDEIDSYSPPALSDFNILSGPFTSNSMSSVYVNGKGKTVKKTTISYILQPKKQGNLHIESATLKVGGKVYNTEQIAITVGPAVEGQAEQRQNGDLVNATSSVPKNNVHLVATVSNASPYIGEPITVTYKLYYRMNLGQISASGMPKFDSFWTQAYTDKDLHAQNDQRDYYKNELYNVATFYKVLLIPQKAGNHTIDPISISTVAEIGTGQLNYWGEEITRVSKIDISCNRLSINVRPLPEKGKPASFEGAVGHYQMTTSLSPEKVQTGASSTLAVTVSGTGNISLIHLPKLSFPQEIESYDPQTSNDSHLTASSLQGTAKVSYILIPRLKGTYKIPETVFSYFDPREGKYITLSSGEKELTASGDAPASSGMAQPSTPSNTEKTKVDYLNNDISYIQLSNNLVPKNDTPWHERSVFYILFLLPLCIIPCLLAKKIWDNTVDRNSPESRARRAAKVALSRMSKAKKALDNGQYEDFYCETENAIYSFIQDKLKIKRADASIENIGGRLIARGADAEIASQLTDTLEKCNMARYAGFSSTTAADDYQNALHAIENVNKSIKG